jgi:general secretion pathway protein N
MWALWGGLIGAVVALILNLPAQWMAQGLAHVSKGLVQLHEAQGSIWNGSGKLILTGGVGSRDALALPGRLHWQTNFSLNENNLPRLSLKVQATCCMSSAAKLHITPLKSLNALQLQVDDHRSEWPAQWLSGLGAPWNTMQPEGALVLETQQLAIEFSRQSAVMVGSLNLTAQNLSSKLSTLKPMGSYQLSLTSDAGRSQPPLLNLSTQSGSLLLSGQGQWQGSQFQFRGEASAVPEHAAALSNLLNIIGRRQGARSLLSLG